MGKSGIISAKCQLLILFRPSSCFGNNIQSAPEDGTWFSNSPRLWFWSTLLNPSIQHYKRPSIFENLWEWHQMRNKSFWIKIKVLYELKIRKINDRGITWGPNNVFRLTEFSKVSRMCPNCIFLCNKKSPLSNLKMI